MDKSKKLRKAEDSGLSLPLLLLNSWYPLPSRELRRPAGEKQELNPEVLQVSHGLLTFKYFAESNKQHGCNHTIYWCELMLKIQNQLKLNRKKGLDIIHLAFLL